MRYNNPPVAKPLPKKEPRTRPLKPVLIGLLILILLLAWAWPLPKIQLESGYNYKSRPEPVSLSWPSYGQAAVGAVSYGVLDTHASQTAVPMASVTKALTAMAVLKKKPLKPGDQGPTIVLNSQDVAYYNDYAAKGGSVVAVTDGEQISEHQALQAMLIPSANNMADSLVRWAFGSMSNYTAYTNGYLKQLGARNTTAADASGFSPKSVSTAEDLTALGLVFMQNPVLSDIVGQRSADIPVAGKVLNTNSLLGTDGIVGIKTGNTDEAGGCYLFASKRTLNNYPVTVVGAIMGAPDLDTALRDSQPLLSSTDDGFMVANAVKRGQVVGRYVTKWGNDTPIVAKDDVRLLNWKTRQVTTSLRLVNKTPIARNERVGTLTATVWGKSANTALIAQDTMNSAGWQWRLYSRYLGG